MRAARMKVAEESDNVQTVSIPSTPFQQTALFNFLVLCGRWETFPREFAKCRRCRKAKYCGKDCQSTAWSEGHRFWCSAKDPDDDGDHHHHHGERRSGTGTIGDSRAPVITTTTSGGTITGRAERRADRDRQRTAVGTDTVQGTVPFRSNAGTDVNTTLAALNSRSPAQNGQSEYLRLLNNPHQQPSAESSTASTSTRRRAETLAAPQFSQRVTVTPGNTDLTVQQRPFLPELLPEGQLGRPGTGPSRRGRSPAPAQDADMFG